MAAPSAGKKIIGNSKSIQDMIKLIERVSPTKTNILVTGESGTGKELVARMIHDFGPLKGKPFVAVNCGAIPENLIESELFGHKRGSFTGAVGDKHGLFEVANGGSIFLDEVGELPLQMQVKLLRVIQDRTVRRVGDTSDTKIEVRIIAATNRDLEEEVKKGRFREDLYYRLNVIHIHTPPLRIRQGDIEQLAQFFLERFSVNHKKPLKGFDPAAMEAIRRYHWPGNVRELENAIERSVALENSERVTLASLPSTLGDLAAQLQIVGAKESASGGIVGGLSRSDIIVPAPDFTNGPVNLDEILGSVEKKYLMAALEQSDGVKKKAAALLGITFRSIRYRLTKLGVDAGGDDGETDSEISNEDDSEK